MKNEEKNVRVKKPYVKPQMDVITIAPPSLMAASGLSEDGGKADYNTEEKDDAWSAASKGHDTSHGLWDDEE